MPRFDGGVPHGVIPATLLALHDDGCDNAARIARIVAARGPCR